MAGKLVQPGNSTPTQQLVRSNQSFTSDNNLMLRQIQGTHFHDGREVDVKPILQLVEDVLSRASMTSDTIIPGIRERSKSMEDKAHLANVNSILDPLAHIIDRLSSEIAYKCSSGEIGHQTTVNLLNILTNFSWDAKLVLTLAAFALNSGEFWLLVQLYSSNKLAKSMMILKRLPGVMEQSAPLKHKFNAIINLTIAMLDLTWCIVELNEISSADISVDLAELASAVDTIPIAVYWTMRAVLACAAYISGLTSFGHEYGKSTMEEWELSALAHKIKSMYDYIYKQVDAGRHHLDEKREKRLLYEMIHIDNMKVLKALLSDGLRGLLTGRDDQPPLFDGSLKRRDHLEALRSKNVLLLISSLDISQEELSILEQIYNESRQHAAQMDRAYEMVWVPIVDQSVDPWTEDKQTKFESLQSTMTWFTVHHPTQIDRAVIRFVKEKWHFRHKPILVVLDPQGRVVSPNAIHMMWIWRITAFPFTSQREEDLWRGEAWRLELLVNGIDQTVLNWIREEKYIFLYGGDDIEWIRRFTTTARSVALSSRIPLEMVYVGKSSKKEQVRRIITAITNEKLRDTWQDKMIWSFWTRLESMLFSKIQLGQINDHDRIMQEIKKLLSYDKSGSCWAVLSRGAEVAVNGHGSKVMPTLLEYDSWKEHVGTKGFDRAFKDYHDVLHAAEQPCCRFEFHITASIGRIPANMKCPECFRVMEKYLTFCCCHDREIPNEALLTALDDNVMAEQPRMRSTDRGMVMPSDDNVMLKQIQDTHHHDGGKIDVKPIIQLVEDTISPGIRGRPKSMEDKAHLTNYVNSILDPLAHIIDRLSSEIAYKCSSGEIGHQTTVNLLNILTKFSWDAKLVLTLAVFALNYGEVRAFRLLVQLYSSNQLAKSMAILKHLPSIMEQSAPWKPKFDAIINLSIAMLDLTWCIVELNEISYADVFINLPEFASAVNKIPIAVYWTMRGVLACTAHISGLTSISHECGKSTMEEGELSALAHKIKSMYDYFNQQVEAGRNYQDEQKEKKLMRLWDEHIDNIKVLKVLLSDGLEALMSGRESRDDQPPLFDGSLKRRDHLEALRSKNVLLLISSLDISQEELSILEQIYNESRQHAAQMDRAYEMVWVPIVDRSVDPWTEDKQTKFESLQSTMTWFTVHHPTQIDRAVIRFVKEKWHFRDKPILVVLDQQGMVMSPNAIQMMWIWGTTAFPFTSQREEDLWRVETWRLELLVNGIDQTVLNWIRDEKYIFVYGGDDIEWIRRFTREARAVALSARIPLEMVYVGKSNKKERVRKIIATITDEKLSYAWQEVYIWFFWTRLESMLHSKIQLGQADDIDPVMGEIKKLLSSDKSGPWAVLCRGSEVVVNGHGTMVVTTLEDYEPVWKSRVPAIGFVPAFREHHSKLHEADLPCCRFEFPSMAAGTGRLPERIKCPECYRAMENYVSFTCCHD